MLPVLREHHYTYCIPVTLGRNVWVGANVSILPGVTIGDNCVIGAGSVATHSIPANSVAYGAPCEVAREIGDKDSTRFLPVQHGIRYNHSIKAAITRRYCSLSLKRSLN